MPTRASRPGPIDGITAAPMARRGTAWDVFAITMIGTAVLAVLVSGGWLRWTDERITDLTGPESSWIEPAVRHFDNALRRAAIGGWHGAIRAAVRRFEALRFGGQP